MNLISNWRTVLKKAWSVRLMVLVALLSGAELALSLIDPKALGIPNNLFTAAATLVTAAAVFARLVAQTGVTENVEDADVDVSQE